MTLIALDDVIFKIEVHVLNGMWLPAVDFFRNSATVQITSPKRARHLDEYTQNVLEEETRYDDVDWLTLMMIYSGTGSFFNLNDKVRDAASSVTLNLPRWRLHDPRRVDASRETVSVPHRTRTTGPGRTRPSSIKRRSRTSCDVN